MSEEEIMSEEAFNELIDNLENIEKLTPYGRKAIKYWVNKLQKENDILKNHIHYKKCQKCGKEFRTKRSDTKYCNECKKDINKEWYKNLTEEQKNKRREQSKISMRKIRKERKQND